MTRLFGYFTPNATPDELARSVTYTDAVANAGRDSPPTTARCHGLHTLVKDGIHLAIAGRAIWQGRPVTEPHGRDVLHRLMDRYREAGPRILAELDGPFALAVLHPAASKALLAIDRMGIERACYAVKENNLVFGDSANDVAGFPAVGRELRNQALYDFLFMHMVPAPETVYEDIFKLPPATALVLDSGNTSLDRYWQPRYAYASRKDFEELRSSLRQGLRSAVIDSGTDAATGAFLSGGLDSSSVAGTLAQVSSEPARTFTVGFGETEYDELQFARIANQRFGCRAFEYQMRPADIVEAFPQIAAAYDEPFGNSSAAPTYFCARLAADNGVTHLLAGDGGDELFGGNERYVRQRVFELYKRLPAWIRNHVIEPATRGIAPESPITPMRKLRSYVDQALITLPDRFESWNFMYREGGTHMLDKEFEESIDTDAPIRLMRDVWESAPSDDLLEKMLWYDWRFTLADNDLRKVNTMCDLTGVRVSYPMLHSAVVDLSTRVPPAMKIQRAELRHFFKQSMTGFLPDEIIRKKKHGFGLPFGLWLKTDKELGELIYSHLTDLKRRHIIDAGFIDDLLARHRAGHASYFGYAIWDLAMLQAWLGQRVPGN